MMNIKHYLYPLGIALSLLTRLPVNRLLSFTYNDKYVAWSALYYPVVGLLLALLLYLPFYFIFSQQPPLLVSAVTVTLWVALTGALHLDGLADSIDAAYAAHGQVDDKQRRTQVLAVFKDPTAGPMAVVGLVLLLLLKVIILSYLLHSLLLVLVVALVLSRTLAVAFIISTPYARPDGLGKILSERTPKALACTLILFVLFLCFIILPMYWFFVISLLCGIVLCWWRYYWLKKIHGFVGDCVGALIELSEVLVLIVLYMALPNTALPF